VIYLNFFTYRVYISLYILHGITVNTEALDFSYVYFCKICLPFYTLPTLLILIINEICFFL